jgi:hypothetical protein
MGEGRMSKESVDWFGDYEYVAKTFAGSSIPTRNQKHKLTKQGWHDAWIDMVSLCARALEYKDEANKRFIRLDERAKKLEDELQHSSCNSTKITGKYNTMVKSFDELGEKYTKDMDALMKLLILLGRKIDE